MLWPDYVHCLPLPTPFPVGAVNVYLITGDPLTLIDAGPNADVSLAALEAGLGSQGYAVEDLRRLILTHHHVDHVGLAAHLVERSGAEVLTHPYNIPWLENYGAERERQRPFYLRIWQEGGVPDHIIQAIETASGSIGRWVEPLTGARPIDEGDHVNLGGEPWQVFHTPGHAGGLICLWEPRTRTLLANDHFIRDISSNPVLEPPPLMNGPRPRRLVEYLHHMQRMAELAPAVALAGHGEPVTDVRGLVRQRLAFHERRAQKILAALNGQPQTLWALTQPLFPRLERGMDYFLALSEVLGHLDLLEQNGRLRAVREGGVVKWTAVKEPAD